MARIPTDEGSRTLPAVPTPGIPAATGIGQGLQRLGAAAVQVADDALERRAELAAQKAAAETRDEFSRRSLAMEQEAPLGAPGHEDAIAKVFDAAAADRLEAAPPRARDRLEIWLDGERNRVLDRARQFEAASRVAKNKQDTLDTIALNANAVRTEARHYDEALTAARTAVAVSGLNAPSRAALTRTAEDRITAALVQGLNETDPDRATRLLESGELDAMLSPEAKNILVNDNQVERGRRAAARAALVTEARAEIRDVIGLLEDGFDPGVERLTRLEAVARGDPALAEDLGDALDLYEFMRTARGMTPADLQNWINTERAVVGGMRQVDTGRAGRLQAAEGLLNTMNTELARDPLSWAARAGVHQVAPLSLSGEDAPASIAQRIQDRRQVAAYYYGIPVPYLTDEEATQLTGIAEGKDIDAKLELVKTILGGFGDRAAPAVLRQISEAGAPAFGHAGGLLLTGDARAARDVLVGEAALSAKDVALPPKIDRDDASEAWRGAFALSPATGGNHARATEAIYAARAARRGLDPAVLDKALWERSGQLAAGAVFRPDGVQMGGLVDFNGFPVVVPADIAADQFADLVAKIDDADLAGAVWADGSPVKAEDLHNGDLWLVSAGHGRYRIAATDPADGNVLYAGAEGGTAPYLLDLSAGGLLPTLRARPRRIPLGMMGSGALELGGP